MKNEINRREFLETAAAATAFTIVPRAVLGQGHVPPSDKITVAHVGFGTEAIREVASLLENPYVQLTAVCDVEKDGRNYLEWFPGGIRDGIRVMLDEPNWHEGMDWVPGGRDIGKEIIEAYYAKMRAAEKFSAVNTYVDFREMLEKEKDLDGVKVMTPDHLHGVVAIAAMNKGKHVMVAKPLSNRLAEARLVIETARRTRVVTHFMPANHNLGFRTAMQWVQQGAIGQLREIHNWSSRPVWPQYLKLPTERPPIPEGFDWTLWQGPVLDRPYHPWFTHTTFRGWFDYGGGAINDMGIYSNWTIFQDLALDAPYMVETSIANACEALGNQTAAKIVNDYSFPLASTARMRFREKGGRPAIDIFWYDGGMMPPTPEELFAEDRTLANEGMLLIGDKGKIMADFEGDSPRIIPESKFTEFRKSLKIDAPPMPKQGQKPPMPAAGGKVPLMYYRPEMRGSGPAHSNDSRPWVEAVRKGSTTYGDFQLAGPISEAFNLVAISYRMGGKRLLWNSAAGKITNDEEANRFLHREYRPGWNPEG
jgi:predicted dehydrogenase